MTFSIRKASDSYTTENKTIEIKSLDDLKKIDDENNNCGLILCFGGYGCGPSIVIYDDYVE